MALHGSHTEKYSNWVQGVIAHEFRIERVDYSVIPTAGPAPGGGIMVIWIIILTTKGPLLGQGELMTTMTVSEFCISSQSAFEDALRTLLDDLVKQRSDALSLSPTNQDRPVNGSGLIT